MLKISVFVWTSWVSKMLTFLFELRQISVFSLKTVHCLSKWAWFDESKGCQRACNPSTEVKTWNSDQKVQIYNVFIQYFIVFTKLPHKLWFLLLLIMFFWFLFSSTLFAWKKKKIKWSTELTISSSKHQNQHLFCTLWTIISSMLNPNFCKNDHVSVSEMKENARSFHSTVNTNTQCTQ